MSLYTSWKAGQCCKESVRIQDSHPCGDEAGGGRGWWWVQSLRKAIWQALVKVSIHMLVVSNPVLVHGSQRNPHRWDLQEAIWSSMLEELQHNLCDLQVDPSLGGRRW